MNTKNIFRMLLVAAALLVGVNSVKADDIWTTAQNAGSTFTIPAERFNDVKKGSKLNFHITVTNIYNWDIQFKISEGAISPDFKDFSGGKWGNTWVYQNANDKITDGYLQVVCSENTAANLKLYGLTISLNNLDLSKVEMVNEAPVTHTVTFVVDDETYETATVEVGEPITLPDAPTKANYVFTGWSGLPTSMPDNDVTVTAQFREGVETAAWAVGGYSLDWDFVNKGIVLNASSFRDLSGTVYVRVYGTGGNSWQVQLAYVDGSNQAQKPTIDGNNEGIISIYSSSEKNGTLLYGYIEYQLSTDILNLFAQYGARVGGWDFTVAKVTVISSGTTPTPPTPTPTDITLTFSQATAEAVLGESFTAPTLTATAGEETITGLTFTYTSSEEGVATVDNSGNVTLVGAGTTTITATFAGNDTYNTATASYELTVSEKETPPTPVETVTATITSNTGYATFCSAKALDFTGITTVKAYYAREVADNEVRLTQIVGTVAAGTGMVIKGTSAQIPVVESGTAYNGNKLVGVITAAATVNASNQYVLVNKSGEAKFADTAGNAATVPVGKAYLEVTANSRVLSVSFEDETTAISTVDAPAEQTKAVYNLRGQRVLTPQRGLYIVDGKKVMMK